MVPLVALLPWEGGQKPSLLGLLGSGREHTVWQPVLGLTACHVEAERIQPALRNLWSVRNGRICRDHFQPLLLFSEQD